MRAVVAEAQTALALPLALAVLAAVVLAKQLLLGMEMLVLAQQTQVAAGAGIRGRKPHPLLEVLVLAALAL